MSGSGWIIRVESKGHKERLPQFVASRDVTWDGSWYWALGPFTKVFKRRHNAERWLRERPDVVGYVELDPRAPDSPLRGYRTKK